VIAAARADIGDSHAGPDAETANELPGFVDAVALLLARPDRADDLGNGSIGFRERARGRAGRRERSDLCQDCRGDELQSRRQPQEHGAILQ
jgi:hypothetical protein